MLQQFGVLVDLSGTLFLDDIPIQGAVEAVLKLHQMPNVKSLFVTNSTRKSSRVLHERLSAMLGVEIETSEIFSALSATRQVLVDRNLKPSTLILEDNVLEEFEGLKAKPGSRDAVVIGSKFTKVETFVVFKIYNQGSAPSKFDYQTLNMAFKKIFNEKAEFIAVYKGRYFPTSKGVQLGPGAFVDALEFATGVRADVVGKPEKAFFQSALTKLNCSRRY